nr:unnamed protein product [Spirometra erinaceieuropaei]
MNQSATILKPLYRLLEKNYGWHWSEVEQSAFEQAKAALTSSSVLVHYDPEKPIILKCDASPYGVGAEILCAPDSDLLPRVQTLGLSMKSFHVPNVRAICFDVDSTVSTNDGLDELGQYMGKAQLIADITNKAMDGVLDLPVALDQRLDALKLTKTNIESFKQRVPISLTPGIRSVFSPLVWLLRPISEYLSRVPFASENLGGGLQWAVIFILQAALSLL